MGFPQAISQINQENKILIEYIEGYSQLLATGL